MPKMLLFYVPCQDLKEAKKIARDLLKRSLIACANFFPIDSMYWWKGKIEEDREVVMIAKTIEKNHKRVVERIRKLHSYTKPCIIAFKVDKLNKEYSNYLKEELEIGVWKRFLKEG
ncbi:MAG: divalent-cation tolerance protein CutA [archaeon]